MTTHKQFLTLGLVLLSLVSLTTACNEDEFLSRVPPNRYTPLSFFTNEEQVTEAVTGLYPLVRGLHTGAVWQYGEFRSDNTTFEYDNLDRGRTGLEEVDYFLMTASSGLNGAFWEPGYAGVSRANFIMDRIDAVPFSDPTLKTRRLAEAHFFRAYFYYLLTIHYGDVVIVTEPISQDGREFVGLERRPLEEVYEQVILPDLEFAIENLPLEWPIAETGRVTQGAANMLAAKAHFARGDYTAALPHLDAIVRSGQYRLLDNYGDVFAGSNPNNDEIIWAAQFNAGSGQGSGFMLQWLPESGTDITDGPFIGQAGFNIPTCDLIEAYEDGDRRFAHDIAIYDADPMDPDNETFPYSTKFLEVPFPTQGGIDVDIPIYRYADVLLMQAEAQLETMGGLPNNVFETLNRLRARAGLPFYFPGNPDPELDLSTTEDLLAAVRRERRVELAFENHRTYDLRRYGTFEATMLAHGEEQKMKQDFLANIPEAYTNIRTLLAIPAGQVQVYGYRQNEGW